MFTHQNNNWIEIKNNTMSFTSYTMAKSLQKDRPLNRVQSGQNFAHTLIFLCVGLTMAAFSSQALPDNNFLGHSNIHAIHIVVQIF